MAARNHQVVKSAFRLLTSRSTPPATEGLARLPSADEFDESDVVWGGHSAADFKKQLPSSTWKKPAKPAAVPGGGGGSRPVNIPDWSKVLLQEYNNSSSGSYRYRGGYEEEEEEEGEVMVPPHEVVGRRRAASLSVEEGIGRTLKGRDLSRVRNAIWAKTGFQD